ncbi:hypothetical protein [Acetobacter sp.]|uniref:hypothetical protein n=1 Tax=Acetobacter sp. TaxID=440 RepID=UPI0039EC1EE4
MSNPMLFNTLKVDTAAINEGRAVPFPGADKVTKIVPEVTVRGYTDDFINARNAARRALADKYDGDWQSAPNEEVRQMNARLLKDHIVTGISGLFNGPGPEENPVTLEQFTAALADPVYAKYADICWQAAAKVTQDAEKQRAEAEGN